MVLFGFFVLGLLAYRTYTAHPPVPQRVVDRAGPRLFTGEDISAGQQVFLRNGLMEYGSVFGHGAYLGPGLHRRLPAPRGALACDRLRRRRVGRRAARRTIADFKTNRYDRRTGTLVYTDAQAQAFEQPAWPTTAASSPTRPPRTACGPSAITDPDQIRQLTAFFAWTAWAAVDRRARPGPTPTPTTGRPEPLVDNRPTADMRRLERAVADRPARRHRRAVRRVRPLGRRSAGTAGEQADAVASARPARCALTPAQRASAWFFFWSWRCCSWSRRCSARRRSTTGPTSTSFFGIDLARRSSRTTWPAPGTCSCRSSGSRPRSWPPASSWRRSSPAASPRQAQAGLRAARRAGRGRRSAA